MGVVTRDDIERWTDNFNEAKRMLFCLNLSKEDEAFLRGRINDGIYLMTLVESLMVLEEPEGVTERARRRQGVAPNW